MNSRMPAWLRSLVVPISIALVLALLLAFAWVVQGVVNGASAGASIMPVSPSFDLV